MVAKVYVPRDSSALSMGAEHTAKAIVAEAAKRGVEITLIRNGSRGLFYMEPLVEVETASGRVAYAPVTPKDVPSLFDADFLNGGARKPRDRLRFLLLPAAPYKTGHASRYELG